MGKDFWKSKTFWFNALALTLAIVSAVAGHFGYDDFQMGKDMQEIVVLAVAVINLILRYVTVQPITRISAYRKR